MLGQSSQHAEPLWTDPGLMSGISVRQLNLHLKKKKAQAGNELPNILPKCSHERKKPPHMGSSLYSSWTMILPAHIMHHHHHLKRHFDIRSELFIVIIIYPLTTRVFGAPQMISQPVFSIFPCSPLPSWTWRSPGLSVPERQTEEIVKRINKAEVRPEGQCEKTESCRENSWNEA